MPVTMICLGVKDPARSIKFYGETLRLQLVGQPGEVTLFQAGPIQIALNHPLGKHAGDAITGAVEVVFSVASVRASFEMLAGRGCAFLQEPREVFPGTWGATLTDPDGHKLTLLGAP